MISFYFDDTYFQKFLSISKKDKAMLRLITVKYFTKFYNFIFHTILDTSI